MFQSGFKEGDTMLKSTQPSIEVHGDEFLTMKHILEILHYQGDSSADVSAESLTAYAIHCDKYDFVKALGPWVKLWFEKVYSGVDHSKKLGHLVLAAYMFRDETQFTTASHKAILQLVPGFASDWDLIDQHELLPPEISREFFRQYHCFSGPNEQ
jgi:hypothetical protein